MMQSNNWHLPVSNAYRLQDGCHNCVHVFVKSDYDEERSYYCTLNAPPRPLCLSVGMDECEKDRYEPEAEGHDGARFAKAWKKWEDWTQGRTVEAFGICNRHESTERVAFEDLDLGPVCNCDDGNKYGLPHHHPSSERRNRNETSEGTR